MQSQCIWDSLARKYDRLWVQKYSLEPTRKTVKDALSNHFSNDAFTLLDLGCGTGQLLSELQDRHPSCRLLGLDKSPEMIYHAKCRGKDIELFCLNTDKDDLSRIVSKGIVNAVVCCHSFPYYMNKKAVLAKIHSILAPRGIAIFVQASINNLYDKLILRIVEVTAEKAEYLSREAFLSLSEDLFEITEEYYIHEQFFMPSICGFKLRKRT